MSKAKQLYARIADLAPSAEPVTALALAEAHWSEISARDPNPYDAESCRLLSLAALEQSPPDFLLAEVWRIRALARFTLTGWHEGVASVVMGRAFTALSRANDDYSRGNTLDVIEGSPESIELLDELGPFLRADPSGISVGPNSPSQAVIARFFHEKRGFFLLALGRLDEALESYERAAEIARGSARGMVKVRLGRALVDYSAGNRGSALAETRSAVEEAHKLGQQDLVTIGEHNIAVMESRGANLRAYEVL